MSGDAKAVVFDVGRVLFQWDLRCLFDFNPEQLTVYDGWPANGLHHLTPPLLGQRLEAYLASLLRRMAGAKG